MKKLMTITMMIIGAFSFSALAQDPADVNLTKASMGVDFNRMIDGNNVAKKDIQKNIDASLATEDADEVSERSRVLDFVDVEVGIGETPNPVVDRRFDSVSEPQLIDLKSLVPIYIVPEQGI